MSGSDRRDPELFFFSVRQRETKVQAHSYSTDRCTEASTDVGIGLRAEASLEGASDGLAGDRIPRDGVARRSDLDCAGSSASGENNRQDTADARVDWHGVQVVPSIEPLKP